MDLPVQPDRTPFEQAQEEMPKRIYEGRLPNLVSALGAFALVRAGQHFGPHISEYIQVSSGIVLTAGAAAADRLSTIKTLSAVGEAKDSGVSVPYKEQNPFLRTVQSGKDYNRRKMGWAIDLFTVATAGIGWVASVPLSGARLTAAMNNNRKAERTKRAIDINRKRSME